MRTITKNTTTGLERIEGAITKCATGLNSFQELLDRTFNYIKTTETNNFSSLPMWLFNNYNKHSEIQEDKSLYALEKYQACAELKTALYQEILENLGVKAARTIFGLTVSKNINRNDISLTNDLGLLRIA